MNARISKQAGRKLAGSPEARRRAQVVLEVLAGSLTPHQGAESLGISAPKYYVVESRALDGLIAGCEPRRKGRTEAPERELDRLRREQARLLRQCARYQALVRAAHRAVGAAAPRPEERGKRKKKPAVRALKFASALQAAPGEAPAAKVS